MLFPIKSHQFSCIRDLFLVCNVLSQSIPHDIQNCICSHGLIEGTLLHYCVYSTQTIDHRLSYSILPAWVKAVLACAPSVPKYLLFPTSIMVERKYDTFANTDKMFQCAMCMLTSVSSAVYSYIYHNKFTKKCKHERTSLAHISQSKEPFFQVIQQLSIVWSVFQSHQLATHLASVGQESFFFQLTLNLGLQPP